MTVVNVPGVITIKRRSIPMKNGDNPELSARVSVMLGKTFCGMEHATKVASALSCLLGA